jgi:hypothetical protein
VDLTQALAALRLDKERIERAIGLLEELQRSSGVPPEIPSSPKRRGRKSMGTEERRQVSERMLKHWHEKRNKPEG